MDKIKLLIFSFAAQTIGKAADLFLLIFKFFSNKNIFDNKLFIYFWESLSYYNDNIMKFQKRLGIYEEPTIEDLKRLKKLIDEL